VAGGSPRHRARLGGGRRGGARPGGHATAGGDRRAAANLRVTDALDGLAHDLDHPTADTAIAALKLVVGGGAGTGRIHPTVSALAAATRDEVRARERVDRTRAVYQSSMKRLVVILGLLVAYLKFAAGELLDAYSTPIGQIVLLVPLAMWAGCIAWLRSMCGERPNERHRRGAEASALEVAA
jgi:hypothetical protein